MPVLLVLLLPTGNFVFELGVTWTPWKLLLLIYWAALPAQYAMRHEVKRSLSLPPGFSRYVIAIVISTLLVYAFGHTSEVGDFVGFRDPTTRPFVQLISLFLRMSAVLAIVTLVQTPTALYRLLNGVIAASTLVASYGIYQVIGYYMDWPIMGISRAQELMTGQFGIFSIGDIDFFRLGSYVGEPKEAAKFLATSTVILIGLRVLGIKGCSRWFTSYWILGLHVIALILTFSTSSFFAIGICSPVLGFLWLVLVRKFKVRSFLTCTVVIVIAMCILSNVVGEGITKDIYEARVTGRIGSIDSPEKGALQFLQDEPEYLLVGVGLGNASFYLRPYFNPQYAQTLTVSLSSFYLEMLLEGGIVGLAMLLLLIGGWLIRSLRVLIEARSDETRALLATALGVFLFVATVAAFSSTDGNGQLWLFFGVLISTYRIAQEQRHQVLALARGSTAQSFNYAHSH